MNIIYSILDDQKALKELQASGITREQIQAILAATDEDARKSPPNFTFVGALKRAPRKVIIRKTDGSRSVKTAELRKLKRVYGVLARQLKLANTAAAMSRIAGMNSAKIAALRQPLKKVDPAKSDSERRELLAKLEELEPALLIKQSRRARTYLIKRLSERRSKDLFSEHTTASASKKNYSRNR